MGKRKWKYLAAVLLACVLVAGTPAAAMARTPVLMHKYAGKATHTSCWTNWGNASKTTTTGLFGKIATTMQKKKGSVWTTPWFPTTDNFRHVKGENDLSHEKSTSITHQFSGSVNAEIKGIGVEAGYSLSRTSSQRITSSVAKSAASGSYFFACRAKMIDLRKVTTTQRYKKTNGKWKLNKTSVQTVDGALIYSTPATGTGLYYEWRRAA